MVEMVLITVVAPLNGYDGVSGGGGSDDGVSSGGSGGESSAQPFKPSIKRKTAA